MKFVLSYSCGKDSTLALHRLLKAGHTPVALLSMIHAEQKRVWFHGADSALLERISQSLRIPLLLCSSGGAEYHLALEAGLRRAKTEYGAELAAFGDIDLEANRAWEQTRCDHTGLQSCFPLWQQPREDIVQELLQLGYVCLIKTVNNQLLPKSLLGRSLDGDVVQILRTAGVDVCGENGEFHTIAVDGPAFHTPVPYTLGQILNFGDYSAIEIL